MAAGEIPRAASAALLAQCVISQGAIGALLKAGAAAGVANHGFTIMHLLASFGDSDLMQAAIAAMPKKSVAAQLAATSTPRGRTPAREATLRGYPTAANEIVASLQSPELRRHEVQHAEPHSGDFLDDKPCPGTGCSGAPSPPTAMKPKAKRWRLAAREDSGGWSSDPPKSADADADADADAIDFCNFDIENSMSAKKFDAKYLSRDFPVLVRNGSAAAFNELREALRYNKLIEAYGNDSVTLTPDPYDPSSTSTTTMHRYAASVTAGTSTVHLKEKLDHGDPLRKVVEAHLPPFVSEGTAGNWLYQKNVRLGVGPKGTGEPAHYHRASVNTLVYGRARWWLMPPRDAVFSSLPVGKWLPDGPERSRAIGRTVLECVQQPGDLLFVPDFWGYASVNEVASVSVTTEFSTPRIHFDPFATEKEEGDEEAAKRPYWSP
jgi:hypothetical protein